MEIFIEASMIHSITVANIHVGEFVMIASAREASMAPVRKYGRRRPRRFHVLSLMCPIIG